MTDETTRATPEPRPRRRGGMFWPLVLIGVGLIALLANYGIIQPVSVVSLLALWPALLILLGIDIAFSRRWPVPTLAAEVVIIGAALVLAATQPSALSLGTFTFTTSKDCVNPAPSVSVPRGSLQSLRLTVNGGAARYRVTGGASAALEATADGTDVCVRDQSSGTHGDISLSQSGSHFGGNVVVTVRVPNDLLLSLAVNGGAGEFLIDLHDVKVTDVRMSVGASTTTIVLPQPTGDVAVRMEGGASNVNVEIPADVEARVIVSGGLISTNSTNPRATKNGSVIETPGYGTATNRVSINISGGASSITVR